jgi:hypothetical protein
VACGDDISNPAAGLCCTDFKVGADLTGVDFGVDASLKGQFAAFAQASGDLSGAASGALDDIAGACKASGRQLQGHLPRDLHRQRDGAQGFVQRSVQGPMQRLVQGVSRRKREVRRQV